MNRRETITAILKAFQETHDQYTLARMESYIDNHVNSEIKKIFAEFDEHCSPPFTEEEMVLIKHRNFKRIRRQRKKKQKDECDSKK